MLRPSLNLKSVTPLRSRAIGKSSETNYPLLSSSVPNSWTCSRSSRTSLSRRSKYIFVFRMFSKFLINSQVSRRARNPNQMPGTRGWRAWEIHEREIKENYCLRGQANSKATKRNERPQEETGGQLERATQVEGDRAQQAPPKILERQEGNRKPAEHRAHQVREGLLKPEHSAPNRPGRQERHGLQNGL